MGRDGARPRWHSHRVLLREVTGVTTIPGLGSVSIRAIDEDHPRPDSPSEWSNWGPMAQEAKDMVFDRWLIEVTDDRQQVLVVGDMSAHAVWYGPTPGSRAMNIGIGLVPEYRRRGIGSIAQRLLAEELHRRGIVRVEASTDVDNVGEQNALKRAGFTFEGTLRMAQQRADGPHDLQVWSHLSL